MLCIFHHKHTKNCFEKQAGQRDLIEYCEYVKRKREDGNWCTDRSSTHQFNKHIRTVTYLPGTILSPEDVK